MVGSQGKAERYLASLSPLRNRLEAFCRTQLTNTSELEDTLQSVLEITYRDFERFTEGTNFKAWIFRYAQLEILNRNRAAARHRFQEMIDVPAPTSTSVEYAGRELITCPEAVLEHCADIMAEAILGLSQRERSVFLLRGLGEFKYAEIAAMLEIPIGTVMSSLSHARQKLRVRLAKSAAERGWLKLDED